MQVVSNIKQSQSEWIEVGKVDAIPRQGARVVERPEGNIAIFRTADDEIFALADRCPHKGGPLSQGIIHGKKVTCPMHDWRIHLDSGEAVAPDEGCAASYPVRIDGDIIYLSLKSSSGCPNQ